MNRGGILSPSAQITVVSRPHPNGLTFTASKEMHILKCMFVRGFGSRGVLLSERMDVFLQLKASRQEQEDLLSSVRGEGQRFNKKLFSATGGES